MRALQGWFDGGGLFGDVERYKPNVQNHFDVTEDGYILRLAKKIYAVEFTGGKCVCCGITDPIILSFHHLGLQEKIETIANIIRGNAPDCSKSALEAEILKCILLCGNCHSEEHSIDNSISKLELLRLCGTFFCTQCGYSSPNIASLHWHHLPGFPKLFAISDCYSKSSGFPNFNRPIEEILAEMAKCAVICKNCHIIAHAYYERFIRLIARIHAKKEEWVRKQDDIQRRGAKRKNRFEDKESKRFDRRGSGPAHNPFPVVCNIDPRARVRMALEDRMINI